MLLFPVKEDEFKDKVIIRFDDINEGFEKFEHTIIEDKNEEEILEYILNLYDENGFDNFYIDLYLNRIEDEDKFLGLINDEDKKIYELIKPEYQKDYIYYKVDKSILPFIIRLSTREVLFSTFYLAKSNKTIWGNYRLKFPEFY